jgi:hypothetical protein
MPLDATFAMPLIATFAMPLDTTFALPRLLAVTSRWRSIRLPCCRHRCHPMARGTAH